MSLFRLLVFVSVFLRSFSFGRFFFPPMHTLKAAPDAHMSKFQFPIQTHMHLRTTKEKPCTCRRMIEDVLSPQPLLVFNTKSTDRRVTSLVILARRETCLFYIDWWDFIEVQTKRKAISFQWLSFCKVLGSSYNALLVVWWTRPCSDWDWALSAESSRWQASRRQGTNCIIFLRACGEARDCRYFYLIYSSPFMILRSTATLFGNFNHLWFGSSCIIYWLDSCQTSL